MDIDRKMNSLFIQGRNFKSLEVNQLTEARKTTVVHKGILLDTEQF